jgi:hypothetical protein
MSEKDKMKKLAGIGDNKSPLSVIEIINKYDYLSKAFKYIVENNDSNYAPYHNINHLLTVTKYDVKNMLIAAIFHDFNHSAGKKKDAANIADAKAGIKEFVEKEDIKVDIDFIDKVLDATEYPYAIESKDLNEFQAIIRDADLTQVFESNWIYQNIFGLSKELNMTPVEFMKGQRKFLESVKFNTAYGEYLAKEKWPQVMKEFEALENIIK